MALSADTNLIYGVQGINQVPVKATSVIFKGSAVGMTAGYARALVAGDVFAGFALEAVTGAAADGGNYVNVETRGLVQLSVSGAAVTDIGADIYASDDGTFTKTAGSNTFIGKVHRYVSSGVVVVAFDTANPA
jgi:predicted RecA/RadA family phage recombinase